MVLKITSGDEMGVKLQVLTSGLQPTTMGDAGMRDGCRGGRRKWENERTFRFREEF